MFLVDNPDFYLNRTINRTIQAFCDNPIKENKTMNYRADLLNYNLKTIETVTGNNINDLKTACKRPGYNYLIKIYAIYDTLPDDLVIGYHYKNNKFYKG